MMTLMMTAMTKLAKIITARIDDIATTMTVTITITMTITITTPVTA